MGIGQPQATNEEMAFNLREVYADNLANPPICAYYTQMGKNLKTSDVYKVAGFTRNQLRGLLDELGYTSEGTPETHQRVARRFSQHDFLVMIVACELDKTFALKRTAIAALVPKIAQELAGPRPVAKAPKLVLTACPPTARYLDGDANIAQGFVLSLIDIFARVDEHILQLQGASSASPPPRSFGPSLIQKQEVNAEGLGSSDTKRKTGS